MADTGRLAQLASRISTLEAELWDLSLETLMEALREQFPNARGATLYREDDDGFSWYYVGGVYPGWNETKGRPVGDPLSMPEEVKESLNEIASFLPAEGESSWIEIAIQPQEVPHA